ncbi:MAG: transposase [Hyphomonadaceae bacterium]
MRRSHGGGIGRGPRCARSRPAPGAENEHVSPFHDSADLRCALQARGTKGVIPNKSNRTQPFAFDKRLYKLRWRIEAAFNRLKDYRRIATRYDKLARNYLASVCLVAALVWWLQ